MKFRISIIALLMATFTAFAQLPAFTLQAVPTNETCSNNGTLTLTPANLTVGALLEYSLYKLPNTAAPISQFTNDFVGGLDSGDYRLVARQTLGTNASPPVQIDFSILDQVVPLAFTVTQLASGSCDLTGTLVATVTSGSGPFFYQIVTGPQTFPPQVSNQFPNLPEGEYLVRVIDQCGEAEVFEYTLELNSTALQISGVVNAPVMTSCTTVVVTNTVTPTAGSIIYPLTVQYTVHFPPPAGDQLIVQQFPTGPPDALELSLTLPVGSDPYTYDLLVTDVCAHAFSAPSNEVSAKPVVAISDNTDPCGDKWLTVASANLMPPYTMVMTGPPGFVPSDFNANYGSPFTDLAVDFGSDSNTVPYGTYTVEITDSCGRTAQADLTIELIEPPVTITATSPNCTTSLGRITISIGENRQVAAVIITAAPPAFVQNQPLPANVSPATPPSGSYTINNLPIGPYTLLITDNCGHTYSPKDTEILPFTPDPLLSAIKRPSCSPGAGSIRLRSPNGGGLMTLIMTAAPPTFQQALPLDLTAQLQSGNYFNGNLPEGPYSFTATDACGSTLTLTDYIVDGYDSGTNNFSVERNCGTFNLHLADTSNITGTYWFQKKNPVTGLYEHPDTGVVYPEGTAPNDTNSIKLVNDDVRLNITNIGTFRILKVYQSFDSSGNTICFDPYPDFSFSGDLEILGAYSLDCIDGSGPSSVFINVLGVPPYTYRIVEKDGLPFVVENGNADIFQNLEPALYKFEVEDGCTRTVNIVINVATLLPLANATSPSANGGPGELLYCSNSGETTATFDLTTFNSIILGNQSADNYDLTYHLTPEDADSGNNRITTDPTAYTNTTNPQTIYVRVIHKSLTLCHDVTSFRLFVGTEPAVTTLPDIYLCQGEKERLYADAGYDAYEWSTGATTPYIDVDTPGQYSVVVKNQYGSSFCTATQTMTVIPTSSAHIDSVDIQDWTENDNSFTLHVSGDGNYVFSIDGVNYQPEPTFSGLEPGVYTVEVKDLFGCPGVTKDILILNYPKFFTPNGDGYNEKWKIRNAIYEPGMMTYIYDRYGKLITGFPYDSPGWDGTYNGHQLPSTDYWFVVERVDGKVHRGHFAMKR